MPLPTTVKISNRNIPNKSQVSAKPTNSFNLVESTDPFGNVRTIKLELNISDPTSDPGLIEVKFLTLSLVMSCPDVMVAGNPIFTDEVCDALKLILQEGVKRVSN